MKGRNKTRKGVITGVKLRGAEKMARIPLKIIPTVDPLRKP
ncbi:MAG: lipoyl synthase, partial [Candidatus Portiera sp.]|nr:lipoyl synthase [Portiera sp.]